MSLRGSGAPRVKAGRCRAGFGNRRQPPGKLYLHSYCNSKLARLQPGLLSIVRIFIVAFRSAKERQNATFAARKATLICRKVLRGAMVVASPAFRFCIVPLRVSVMTPNRHMSHHLGWLICACLAVLVGVFLSGASGAERQDVDERNVKAWPAFRGTGDGQAEVAGLPHRWDSPGRPTNRWTIRLPGYGQSSPVAWDHRVFVTAVSGAEKEHLHVLAIDFEDGSTLWQRDFDATQRIPDRDTVSRGAPTPVVDAERLYCVFESGDVVALTHDGQTVWERSFVAEYGELQGSHGYASSPVRVGELLIIQVVHSGPSYLLAIDAATGQTEWKVDHPSQTGWSSPVAFAHEDGMGVIVSTAGSVRAFDARDGKPLWWVAGLQGNSTASPIVAGDLVVIGVSEGRGGGRRPPTRDASSETSSDANGDGARDDSGDSATSSPAPSATEIGCLAIRLGGRGDVSETHIAWRAKRVTCGYASPVVVGDAAYFVKKTGVVQCVGLADGETRWQQRLPGETWASPIATGPYVMFFSKGGSVAAWDTTAAEMIESSLSATDVVYGVAAVGDSWIIRTGRGLIRISGS